MGCNPPTRRRCETCKHALIESLPIAKENRKLRALVAEQKLYANLLVAELTETVPHADARGWVSSRFQIGEELREKIAKMERKLGVPD